MSQAKYFFLNGEQYFINQHLTIQDLIKYFDYDNSQFVLEYNDQICNKKNWKDTLIRNRDKIELITIVGGG